ncbi:MAG: DEAD/DEAH box helicase family protein, partial [Caldiserica bacterium]|nr:DEAD/DEAH box helicase family protein [Caldisericota bacterium]
ANTQPVAVALIEAKKEDELPTKGLEQAKKYARLNHVHFVFSSNGHRFVEYNDFTGKTSQPIPMSEFPTSVDLRKSYEAGTGISLEGESAKPLLMPYPRGEASRRYYQDAAIRSALEKIASGKKRILLYLATGSGKTFIAVQLLRKIADAGQLHRALFLCDRDELRSQALGAFQNVFGADTADVTTLNPQKNARILIATYQTLNVAGEDEDAKFFLENYPDNYFSHIVIDECHRSAWGKWSIVLTHNSDAVQIGLTATPRYFKGGTEEERKGDLEITEDNIRYFGNPVYEYHMSQGIEDGYLPACEVVKRDIDIDLKGVKGSEAVALGVRNATTGELIPEDELRGEYEAPTFERIIQLPDRVRAMCKDLFNMFLETGGPYQKTVIFCVRDSHADDVASQMNNLYAEWCAKNGEKRVDPYAFKCTAAVGGSQYIADLRGSERSYYIATTVDLITTGVDVPILQNVVFFKYVNSPIAFHQMLGRGSRIHAPTNKLMFRVYDYTNASRLLGEDFVTRNTPSHKKPEEPTGEKILVVEGFDVHINPAGTYIITDIDGKLGMATIEEYKEIIASKLSEEVKTFEEFRNYWIDPLRRKALLEFLPNDGAGVRMLRDLMNLKNCDLYDILAEIGFGVAPKSRKERVFALQYKYSDWFNNLPLNTRETLLALARQFEKGGIEELENHYIFEIPEVNKAGGLEALKLLGDPKDVILEVKRMLFTV